MKKQQNLNEPQEQALNIPVVSGSCFWGHKWTKWKQQKVKMQYIKDGRAYEGYDTIQTRHCVRCNKMQKEDICTY